MAKSCMNESSSVGNDNTFGDKKEKLEREKEREKKKIVLSYFQLWYVIANQSSCLYLEFLYISEIVVKQMSREPQERWLIHEAVGLVYHIKNE